mmetsp:Transcript_7823/g.8010  ORF Transcript_7823/g.8010 Transcript_7823/m.8010 type:complete len:82 (-) Transcript_7823:365-610(-)
MKHGSSKRGVNDKGQQNNSRATGPAPPPPSAKAPASSNPTLTTDRLKIRIKSINTEYLEDPKNTAELRQSIKELDGAHPES